MAALLYAPRTAAKGRVLQPRLQSGYLQYVYVIPAGRSAALPFAQSVKPCPPAASRRLDMTCLADYPVISADIHSTQSRLCLTALSVWAILRSFFALHRNPPS